MHPVMTSPTFQLQRLRKLLFNTLARDLLLPLGREL